MVGWLSRFKVGCQERWMPFKMEGYLPGNDRISHRTGNGKSSTQKRRLGRGYASSREGNHKNVD